jgi:hypothetical protein
VLLKQSSTTAVKLDLVQTETRRFEWTKEACVRDEMSVSAYVKNKVTMAIFK